MGFNTIVCIGFSLDSFDPNHKSKIQSLSNQIRQFDTMPEDLSLIKDADCLLIGLAVPVTAKTMDALSNLKYIGSIVTSFDKIETAYARKKGIAVTRVPGYSSNAVAEFVFGAILEYNRELCRAKKEAKEGNYSETTFMGTEISNKTFGIIGLGSIGQKTAHIANGFDANVIYWSRNRKKEEEKNGIEYKELDSLLAESQIISMHLELNKETEGIINRERIQKIKNGTIIVNTCSPLLFDLAALEERIAKREIIYLGYMAASSPIATETIRRFSTYANSAIYPRLTYKTKEAMLRRQQIVIENMTQFLQGKPQNVVN